MSIATFELGKTGEKLAVDFLINNGYKIIEKNWKVKTGEIDLIAKYKDIIVFIEVKTIAKNNSFLPEDHFNDFKIQKLIKLAQTYFLLKGVEPENYRFDLIAIEISPNKNKPQIRHYKNVIEDS